MTGYSPPMCLEQAWADAVTVSASEKQLIWLRWMRRPTTSATRPPTVATAATSPVALASTGTGWPTPMTTSRPGYWVPTSPARPPSLRTQRTERPGDDRPGLQAPAQSSQDRQAADVRGRNLGQRPPAPAGPAPARQAQANHTQTHEPDALLQAEL
jgi:hypothetical protein